MKFPGSPRWAKTHAILCWAIAFSVWGIQIIVLFWPQAEIIWQLFPDWPHDVEYEAYLRGIALADVVFLQPLLFVTGVGLWQMKRWGLFGGLAVAGAAVYFGLLQISAELFSGSSYHLFGMGALSALFLDTSLFELTHWIGVAGWVLYPAFLGFYCAQKLAQEVYS
jgi:hypothetical protein